MQRSPAIIIGVDFAERGTREGDRLVAKRLRGGKGERQSARERAGGSIDRVGSRETCNGMSRQASSHTISPTLCLVKIALARQGRQMSPTDA